MEVYKDSFSGLDEFDFSSCIPYFKIPFERTRSKCETLMDPLADKIQYLSEKKERNIVDLWSIAHLSVLSRIVEKEIENMNIPDDDLYSDVKKLFTIYIFLYSLIWFCF